MFSSRSWLLSLLIVALVYVQLTVSAREGKRGELHAVVPRGRVSSSSTSTSSTSRRKQISMQADQLPSHNLFLSRRGGVSYRSSLMGHFLRSWRRSASPAGKGGLIGRLKRFISNLWGKKTSSAASPTASKVKSSNSAGAAGGASSSKSQGRIDKHLGKSYRRGNANFRIQKELREWLGHPTENIHVAVGDNIRVWVVTLTGAKGTIFAGEKYKLKFTFPMDYPSQPPSVYFLQPTPRHEHVYTNGDICLNLLGRDWRPNMTAQTLALSILSMLSSAKEKKIPQDNHVHADNPPGRAQENWLYHDDRC